MVSRVLYSLGALLCVSCILGIVFLKTRVISYSGYKKLPSLASEVQVYFDRYGIPHIEGKSSQDVFKVLGYITASERLFQMDLYRRLSQGRLSEIFGRKALQADKLFRTLRFKKSAQEILRLEKLSEQQVKEMNAYLAGVQAFIDEDRLPLEFLLLGYKPDPFDLFDIMAITGYMALTFNEGINGDIFLSELQEKLPESKLNILRNGDKSDQYFFKSQKVVLQETLKKVNQSLQQVVDVAPLLHGSNSWVISSERSSSGFPLFANDPHIGVSNPHVFYEAHIKVPGFEVYGNYLPLVPFPVIGHTAHSVWGLTMAEIDDFNVYLEKINPDNPDEVMFKNEWVALKREQEIIKIKGEKPYLYEVVISPHGPMLDKTNKGIEGKNLSFSWSIYHPDNNILRSLYEIPRAKTLEDFKLAVSHGGAPGLNVTWANRTGDIAWWVLGKFPKLPDGVRTDLVLKGWDGSQEIERYYEIDENPHVVNPESGQIVSANYRPQQPEFQHFDGYWQPGGRYYRIEKLLQNREKWDAQAFMQLQTDISVPGYRKYKSQLLNAVIEEQLDDKTREVLDIFEAWDGECDKGSLGCTVYQVWNFYNTKFAYLDEMGADGIKVFGKTADFWHAYKTLLFNLDHPLWDNTETNRVESGGEQITRALQALTKDLTQRLGSNVHKWRWGRLHTIEYQHPLGKVKPLNLLFNIGPLPAHGGRYVINNLGHAKFSDDFSIVHGPATRRIIDLKNPRTSWGILPTGNSGNFMSPHFDNQTSLYHRSEYREQLMDWNMIRRFPLLQFSN